MERIVVLVSATFLYSVVGRASMASAEMASRTKRLSILISFHCVLSEILSGHAAAEATSKPARQPEGAGRSASPSPSLSHASGVVVGARRRRLAEGSPGEEPDPVRELLDLEEELENLLALRFKERLAFRQCVRHWGTFDAYCQHQSKCRSQMAADPERMRDAFERKQARKQTACNAWAALLDAACEKIEAMDRERKQMQSRLTKEQTSQYLAAKAARGRAQIGGDSSHTAVGEAAVGASPRPPATGDSPTPGDAGSLDALNNELARLRQVVSLAERKTTRIRQALKDHLERRVPSTPPGVPSPERDRAGEARAAWEAQHLQLEQDAKQAREAVVTFRGRLRELNAQKAAYEKAYGVCPGRRGCENAPVRFSRLGITVDARAAATPWYQRHNFLSLIHRSSSGPPDRAALPLLGPRHHVFIAGRQHLSRPVGKSSGKRGRSRAAEGSGKTGDEHKASASTSGLAGPSEFQNERVHCALYGLTNPSSTVASRWQNRVL
ncbi:hypothetical protein TGME49_241710 [Toxoplasma gondii ME49]|uniref:Myosin heavy chain n=3 Tax=Toxoplasma gondii TaxID=5811 RepID=S8GFL8_TOXGM|nr:hypothetical protein TGME49_241710 [Toxoplasma gondii ME49]EPT30635.1 hypothetical protein TGME49_241710 [Toxoplasma gondii ME49]|eukprot:XP_018637590.1 hypothetical protein TGME49_241710 [Toxoplasma gondii ME49]